MGKFSQSPMLIYQSVFFTSLRMKHIYNILQLKKPQRVGEKGLGVCLGKMAWNLKNPISETGGNLGIPSLIHNDCVGMLIMLDPHTTNMSDFCPSFCDKDSEIKKITFRCVRSFTSLKPAGHNLSYPFIFGHF